MINHWAVLLCALLNLLFGALWYSPALFYRVWKAENGFSDSDIAKLNPMKAHGISFILALLMAYNMSFFLSGADTDWKWGLTAGFLTGFGWAAAIFTVIALFEQRSWKYILINGGYIILYLTMVGFIIGIWR